MEQEMEVQKIESADHCSNFSVYASYRFERAGNDTYDKVLKEINRQNQTSLPVRLAQAVKEGRALVYGVVGDSISTGAEAAKGKEYFTLFSGYMESFGIKVQICNVAVGGEGFL